MSADLSLKKPFPVPYLFAVWGNISSSVTLFAVQAGIVALCWLLKPSKASWWQLRCVYLSSHQNIGCQRHDPPRANPAPGDDVPSKLITLYSRMSWTTGRPVNVVDPLPRSICGNHLGVRLTVSGCRLYAELRPTSWCRESPDHSWASKYIREAFRLCSALGGNRLSGAWRPSLDPVVIPRIYGDSGD